MTVQGVSTNRDLIVASIRRAADSHQVNFDYLLTQAKVESGLDPAAKASTSSATGLYQFTAGTWLNVVKRHGDKVGLAEDAAALRQDAADPSRRERILALRKEPQISAQLAARFALDNAQALNTAGHKSIGATELYLAHFLGAGGATTFLDGMRKNPDSPAATALPAAAASNTRIFFDGKSPRSFQQIYDRFAGKFGSATAGLTSVPEGAKAGHDLTLAAKPVNEEGIRNIVKLTIQQTKAPNPNAPVATDAPQSYEPVNNAPVSVEALEKFLKGFALVDHDRGFTPTQRDQQNNSPQYGAMRDPMQPNVSGLAQMGLATRLVLKATDTKAD